MGSHHKIHGGRRTESARVVSLHAGRKEARRCSTGRNERGEPGVIQTAIFFLLALVTVVPAFFVVSLKNVFHSALFLILSMVGVAGLYAMLAADFLFAVQLLVYAGGIM